MNSWGESSLKRHFLVGAIAAAAFFANACFQPFVHWDMRSAAAEERMQKQELRSLLREPELEQPQWELILSQTGLGRAAVRQLEDEEVMQFQEVFLKERETECRGSFFTKQDRAVLQKGEHIPLASVEDGDIFLSFSSHTLGWKHGHAGLVVDAEKALCLEAVMPGCASKIKSMQHWTDGGDFILLRLRNASAAERREIAVFARQNLKGVPYSLFSGIFDRRQEEDCREMTAQCAYLVWYAFMQFGYDLDGDGGRLVTVEDLLQSPELELVQMFGVDPQYVMEKRR